ncbi:uncharacterized protein LOC111535690 isoform X3 [Piliocolobus tephrosceles]|uniref:uncharacterized protein LOC111535690 isoform X3 n=1 Tax=Piliocolobus tephrosceles TaxID=591936 RepID=UPI000C2A0403|nr:uncharacterized protein LOC111535690 isoform X3 [Piliocolobus tephrosceles]
MLRFTRAPAAAREVAAAPTRPLPKAAPGPLWPKHCGSASLRSREPRCRRAARRRPPELARLPAREETHSSDHQEQTWRPQPWAWESCPEDWTPPTFLASRVLDPTDRRQDPLCPPPDTPSVNPDLDQVLPSSLKSLVQPVRRLAAVPANPSESVAPSAKTSTLFRKPWAPAPMPAAAAKERKAPDSAGLG